MSEIGIKHLELIQGIVNRLAGNSFMIKGWSVTLVSALFVLAVKDVDVRYSLIAFFPVPFFWGLDGYFLAKERQFRDLYNAVRKMPESAINFSMDVEPYAIGRNTWMRSVFSETLIPFHGVMVAVVATVRYALSN